MVIATPPLQTSSPLGTPDPSRPPSPVAPLSPLHPISPWPSLPTQTDEPDQPASAPLPNATDVYASIAILGTYLLGGLYLFWALVPPRWGWTDWLPDRKWTLIVPCWLMVVVLLSYWTYAALVIYNTPSFDSPDSMTDPYAGVPPRVEGEEPYYWKLAGADATPGAVDLPINLVGRVLYPPRLRRRQAAAG
ncbi:hypothetical protein IAT38_005974 [Cryptococcus sp. DSM 104549]